MCLVGSNWTCHLIWKHFASHPKGFFSSKDLCGKPRYLAQSGWRQSPKMWTWWKHPVLEGDLQARHYVSYWGHMSPVANCTRVFSPHPLFHVTPWVTVSQVCMRVKPPGVGLLRQHYRLKTNGVLVLHQFFSKWTYMASFTPLSTIFVFCP